MQIVQELCKRPGLNKCGFDMPTIYLPNPNKSTRCANQIEEVCKEIEKTINHTIQNTLNTLEKDCERIAQLIDQRIAEDNQAQRDNIRATGKGLASGLLGIFLPALLLVNFLAGSVSKSFLKSTLGTQGTDFLFLYLAPVTSVWKLLPEDYHFPAHVFLGMLSFLLMVFAKWVSRGKPTLKRKQKKGLLEKREFVEMHVKEKKKRLYQDYLQQSVGDHDL